MPNCGVTFCENRSSNRRDLSFHRIPCEKKKELRQRWINSLKRKTFPKEMYVCSEHFQPDDFQRDLKVSFGFLTMFYCYFCLFYMN